MSTMTNNERAVSTIPAWDPWPRVADWFDNLVAGDLGLVGRYAHSIRIEESMKEGQYVIRAELPGIDPDRDVDIEVNEGILRITASREQRKEDERHTEFRYGRFARTLILPQGADASSISASYQDGILEVRVKMPATPSEARHVPISRAG